MPTLLGNAIPDRARLRKDTEFDPGLDARLKKLGATISTHRSGLSYRLHICQRTLTQTPLNQGSLGFNDTAIPKKAFRLGMTSDHFV